MKKVCEFCKFHTVWVDEGPGGEMYDDGCACLDESGDSLHGEEHLDSCYIIEDDVKECEYFEPK